MQEKTVKILTGIFLGAAALGQILLVSYFFRGFLDLGNFKDVDSGNIEVKLNGSSAMLIGMGVILSVAIACALCAYRKATVTLGIVLSSIMLTGALLDGFFTSAENASWPYLAGFALLCLSYSYVRTNFWIGRRSTVPADASSLTRESERTLDLP